MLDGILISLGAFYGVGATLTAVFLVFVFGPKFLRGLAMPRSKSAMDWLLLPLDALAKLFAGGIGVVIASAFWPLAIAFLFHDRAFKEKERAKVLEREYGDLLDQIHRDKEGSLVLPNDGLNADPE